MSLYDHTRPINDGDLKKAKTFYDIVCWGGLLIVLLRSALPTLFWAT